jgi:hypothetical protein
LRFGLRLRLRLRFGFRLWFWFRLRFRFWFRFWFGIYNATTIGIICSIKSIICSARIAFYK